MEEKKVLNFIGTYFIWVLFYSILNFSLRVVINCNGSKLRRGKGSKFHWDLFHFGCYFTLPRHNLSKTFSIKFNLYINCTGRNKFSKNLLIRVTLEHISLGLISFGCNFTVSTHNFSKTFPTTSFLLANLVHKNNLIINLNLKTFSLLF